MIIRPFAGKRPRIHPSAYIAAGAVIVGDVEIGEGSSIWHGCVLRGDVNDIRIGRNTNIQDGTVIHVSTLGQGTYVGDGVTVGHMALLHACTIGDGAFIGMKACVMDDCTVEGGAMLAAGALLTPGKTVPAGQMFAGSPAKPMRALSEKDLAIIARSADHYADLARRHAAEPTD